MLLWVSLKLFFGSSRVDHQGHCICKTQVLCVCVFVCGRASKRQIKEKKGKDNIFHLHISVHSSHYIHVVLNEWNYGVPWEHTPETLKAVLLVALANTLEGKLWESMPQCHLLEASCLQRAQVAECSWKHTWRRSSCNPGPSPPAPQAWWRSPWKSPMGFNSKC